MKVRFLVLVLAVLTCSNAASLWAQHNPFVADANTIGLWHFDETSGTVAADSSGNSLNGELQNGVAWDADGRFGGCAGFDHSGTEGQRVTVADDPLLDASDVLTIDAWIYLLPTNDGSFVLSKWNSGSVNPAGQFELIVRTDHKLSFGCANNAQMEFIVSESVVPFEQWTLVSATFDNGQMALYFNEEQQAYGQAPFTSLTSAEYSHDELNIGDHWTDAWFPYTFEGKIDEVRISNVARYVITDVGEDESGNPLPYRFRLSQNYPNPFNPVTTIEYNLPRRSSVKIDVLNLLGQKVRTLVDREKSAGTYSIAWDGTSSTGEAVSTGVYLYRFQADDHVETKKMLLLK